MKPAISALKPARVERRETSEPDQATPSVERAGVRWGWLALLIVSLLFLGVSAYLAHRHTLSGVELSFFHVVNDWPDKFRPLFLVATIAPESLWFGAAAVIIVFVLKMYRASWQLAVATIGGYVAAFAGKHFVARPRPVELVSDAHVRVHETGMGFPSGHTMMLTVIILILWPYLPRGWRWAIAFVGISLMGLSRIYLGVHGPLDVVGGFAVGAIVVATLRVLPQKLRTFFRFD